MQGSVVIVGDVLGVVTCIQGNRVQVKDKCGVERWFDSNKCTEVVSPHALAGLMYKKVCSQIKSR